MAGPLLGGGKLMTPAVDLDPLSHRPANLRTICGVLAWYADGSNTAVNTLGSAVDGQELLEAPNALSLSFEPFEPHQPRLRACFASTICTVALALLVAVKNQS